MCEQEGYLVETEYRAAMNRIWSDMVNQPFPYNEEELTDDWLNETDEQNPIVREL